MPSDSPCGGSMPPRYSDTDGYQGDRERTNWPWRDWVIDSFAENKPFDQFTIEQFAGDLLPDATPEQILATCFHRNHMTNGEGGRDPEESRIDYVIDRVNTTGTVWLGLTLGCTQCHDHKFDPVSQKDFYSLFAFFNSIDESGAAGTKAKPYLPYEAPHAAQAVTEAEEWHMRSQELSKTAKSEASEAFTPWLEKTRVDLPADYAAWNPLRPETMQSAEGTEFHAETDGTIQTSGPFPRQDDYRISYDSFGSLSRISGWKLEVFSSQISHRRSALTRRERRIHTDKRQTSRFEKRRIPGSRNRNARCRCRRRTGRDGAKLRQGSRYSRRRSSQRLDNDAGRGSPISHRGFSSWWNPLPFIQTKP